MMNDLLFVYGTLLDDDNKYGVYLRDNSKFHAQGTVKGKLFDIGEYPGAVLVDGDELIYGIILQMDDPETALNLLDIYEGYGEDMPQPNEFTRTIVNVYTETGTIPCWIYLYNFPTNGLPLIEDGRYIK
jgi:gamma-glutamylcyclotransferase (GGCT)/AIG2-like uncharacterized protein YtfP